MMASTEQIWNVNGYLKFSVKYTYTVYDTYVSVSAILYRYDAYDVSASFSWNTSINEPSGERTYWPSSTSWSTSGGYWRQFDSYGTRNYPRKESAYNVIVGLSYNGGTSWSGSYHYMSGSSEFGADMVIPAIQSFTISYDANGGTGAPAEQKKLLGTNIQLSSVEPTRSAFKFDGWALSSAPSTVVYKPNDTYTVDADLSLVAVWRAERQGPSLALSVFRTEGPSSASKDRLGGYVRVEAVWSKGALNVASVACAYSINDGSAQSLPLGGQTSGSSGTAYSSSNIVLDQSSRATVTVTVSDSGSPTVSATSTVSVPSVNFPITFHDEHVTDIYELHLSNLTSRVGEAAGNPVSVTKLYNDNGFNIEVGYVVASGDFTMLEFKCTATTACIPSGNYPVFSIPEEYAPPGDVHFPIWCTNGWASYSAFCGRIKSDGMVLFEFGTVSTVWFGSAVFIRKPLGWDSSWGPS